LGIVPRYRFFDAEWSREDLAELMKTGYGVRTLALIQIDEKTRAEYHLRYLISDRSSDQLVHAVYAVASEANLPRIVMQAGAMIRNRGLAEIDNNVIAAAQYPLPDWEPKGGWSIDRALLFAIMRQESGFKRTATSHAGAGGVMQLMPGTARIVARQNGVSMSDLDIHDPEHNMWLGQQHIVDLLAQPVINNNVIRMLASYNAGMGAMTRWERKFRTDDPLLYIESFPAVETRGYMKRVLSNLWMYRARLGQPLTDVKDLANGKWPMYKTSDQYARTRRDREI